MSTITSVRIDSWGDSYVVVGEFGSHSEISRKETKTYIEALKELVRIGQREVIRYESDSRNHSHW